MAAIKERVWLPDGGRLVIELDAPRYLLSWQRDSREVRYENGRGSHRRHLDGRASAYAFRSVEQMRYDFERDIEAAGGSLVARA